MKIAEQEIVESKPIVTREDIIQGVTTKIKPVNSSHAFYITVNFQNKKPLEIFINTKDPIYYQWLTTITRMLSAIFRKEGEFQFIIDEMKEVHDPAGGYYTKLSKSEKSIFMPSLVAHIGYIIEYSIYNFR